MEKLKGIRKNVANMHLIINDWCIYKISCLNLYYKVRANGREISVIRFRKEGSKCFATHETEVYENFKEYYEQYKEMLIMSEQVSHKLRVPK